MGVPRPDATSPVTIEFADNFDQVIRVSVFFDVAGPVGARPITGITVYRDGGCQWSQILVGLGAGNSPNTTDKAIDVPAGTTVLPQNRLNQLAGRGMGTVEEFRSHQITAA